MVQIVDFPGAQGPRHFQYDAEWLAILRKTHGLVRPDAHSRQTVALPGELLFSGPQMYKCANADGFFSSCPSFFFRFY